ncbi:MAG: Ig-like domain-containing protein [candidate division WOR-3 bacterium]
MAARRHLGDVKNRVRLTVVAACCLLAPGCFWWFLLPDTTPPEVTLLNPKNGEYVTASVELRAQAFDSSGIKKVEFYVDNTLLGQGLASDQVYSLAWSVESLTLGSVHRISALATDSAGNTASTETVQVTVAKTSDVSIYHGTHLLRAGYYMYIPFSANAADSLLGDAQTTDAQPLSSFFWCDSSNFELFRSQKACTKLDLQENRPSITVQREIPSSGQYYIVFANSSSTNRPLRIRFLLRKWSPGNRC